MIVRYACDACQRFWATEDALRGHTCLDVTAVLEAAEDVVESWSETHDGAPDFGAMSTLRRALRGEGEPA